jgi:hypothetical protein
LVLVAEFEEGEELAAALDLEVLADELEVGWGRYALEGFSLGFFVNYKLEMV